MQHDEELVGLAADQAARRRRQQQLIRLAEESANLSLEIESDFLENGPIKYIIASAHQKAVDAFVGLAEIEPTDVDGIRKLQNTIELYSSTLHWLRVGLREGETARKQLDGVTEGLMDDAFTMRDGEDG